MKKAFREKDEIPLWRRKQKQEKERFTAISSDVRG
jgi:hypothetical protein